MNTRIELLNATERRVIRHLKRASKLLTAYQIQNALGIRYPNTVYRALQHLLQYRFVHRIETRNAFVACDDPGQSHRPGFIICTECAVVEEFDVQSIVPFLWAEADKRRFSIETSTVELLGRCNQCASIVAKKQTVGIEH